MPRKRIIDMPGILIGIFFFLAVNAESQAQWLRPDESSTVAGMVSETQEAVRPNIIYLTIGTVLLAGFIDLSYERKLSDFLSVRAGGVASFLFETEATYGPFALVYISPPGRNKVELGAGAAYLWIEPIGPSEKKWAFRPVFSIGYRYQPSDALLCFRLGASYCGAPGIHFGLGFAFPDP